MLWECMQDVIDEQVWERRSVQKGVLGEEMGYRVTLSQ